MEGYLPVTFFFFFDKSQSLFLIHLFSILFSVSFKLVFQTRSGFTIQLKADFCWFISFAVWSKSPDLLIGRVANITAAAGISSNDLLARDDQGTPQSWERSEVSDAVASVVKFQRVPKNPQESKESIFHVIF